MRSKCVVVTLALVIIVAATGAGAQQPAVDGHQFKRSDPRTLNTTGTLQLVEFYHPT